MHRVIGINGSPREGGNTEILLESFLEGAESIGVPTEKVVLNKLDFVPCQECENLGSNEICVIQDDLQDLFRCIEDSDVVVLASPVFFGSLSAQTKMMIDRFQCHWRLREILKLDMPKKTRRGVFLSVEASQRDDFLDNAKSIVKNFFATIDARYAGEVFCKGVDSKGAVLNSPEVLSRAKDLGRETSEF